MEENVISVKPDTGTSPTVNLVTATATLQLAILKLENVISASSLQLVGTVTVVWKASTEILCLEARSAADLVAVLIR